MTIDFEFLDSFDRKRILLVDDDPFILGVLEKLLGLLGIATVLHAGDGEQALRLLDQNAVDLLITDVQMPNLDGLSLLKRIRSGQSSAAASLPCIVVSSLDDEATLATALALDVNGFVQKPFKAPILIKRLLIALSETFSESLDHQYSDVPIDVDRLQLGGHYQPTSTTHQAQHIPLERREKYTVVSLFQLRPDMQLAEDIKTKNGTVLLSAGFTLNQGRVHRMWELEENLEKTSFKVMGGFSGG